MSDRATSIELVAYPAPANPPIVIALALILAGLVAPFLFLQAHAPSPLLGAASLALGLAGIFALAGAVHGRRRVSSDPECRTRARISSDGITLFKAPPPDMGLFFPAHQIAKAHLLQGALIVQTTETHPQPGRHAIRFGMTKGQLGAISIAIKTFQQTSWGSI